MLYSICLGWWLTYKQLRQINIFTHWAPVLFTEMAENTTLCIGAFPSLFHQCESSIPCCQQAHTQTINSANTGPLLLLQQWTHMSGSVLQLHSSNHCSLHFTFLESATSQTVFAGYSSEVRSPRAMQPLWQLLCVITLE